MKKKTKIAKTAPDALKLLWEKGLLSKPLAYKAIEKLLEKYGYYFTSKNLMMTLKNAKFLTRRGSNMNYLYVQKHPYVEEEK